MSIPPMPDPAPNLAGRVTALPPSDAAPNILHADNRFDDVGWGTYLRVRTKVVDWDPAVIATLPTTSGADYGHLYCNVRSLDGRDLQTPAPVKIERDGQEVSFVVFVGLPQDPNEDARIQISLSFAHVAAFGCQGTRSVRLAAGESAPHAS